MSQPSIRRRLATLAMAATAVVFHVGCRACSSCLDYSSPVAGASCGECGGCRAGSCLATGETIVPTVTAPAMAAKQAADPASTTVTR